MPFGNTSVMDGKLEFVRLAVQDGSNIRMVLQAREVVRQQIIQGIVMPISGALEAAYRCGMDLG